MDLPCHHHSDSALFTLDNWKCALLWIPKKLAFNKKWTRKQGHMAADGIPIASSSSSPRFFISIRVGYLSGGEVSLSANWKLILFMEKKCRTRQPRNWYQSRRRRRANNVALIRNDCAASFTYRARFKSSAPLSFIYGRFGLVRLGMLIPDEPHSLAW